MQTARSRTAHRVMLASVLVLIGVMAIALLGWGARWTVPADSAAGASYRLTAAWDGQHLPSGSFDRPIGVAVGPEGDVFVTDARSRVVRLSPAGDLRYEWGSDGDGDGQFRNPVGIAVAHDGSVYVSDYIHDRIQKFNGEGRFELAFGSPGAAPGQFDAPAGVAVDATGRVYVADFYNDRIQRFGASGAFQRVIGHPGRVGAGALHYPTGLDVTADGQLLVADTYNYQLQWFDETGDAQRQRGYHLFWIWPRPASSAAGFNAPTGVAVARSGVLHVADSGNHRIVMVSQTGERLAHWELADPNPAVYSPEYVAVSPDGGTLYATDFGGDRVLVLAVTEP